VLLQHFSAFFRKFLTSNISEFITEKAFTLTHASLHKFFSNIPEIMNAIVSGICKALKDINVSYKAVSNIENVIVENKAVDT
jgi:hypothetical protein